MKNHIEDKVIERLREMAKFDEAKMGYIEMPYFPVDKLYYSIADSIEKRISEEIEKEIVNSLKESVTMIQETSKLVSRHMSMLKRKDIDPITTVTTLIKEEDDFLERMGILDISIAKKSNKLSKDLFDTYYNIVKCLIDRVKETNSHTITRKALNILDDALSYIFREECSLGGYLLDKLEQYKSKLKDAKLRLTNILKNSFACKQIVNGVYYDYYKERSSEILLDIKKSIAPYVMAGRSIQPVIDKYTADFHSTYTSKIYIDQSTSTFQPGDEFACELVKSCLNHEGSEINHEGSENISITTFFDYTIQKAIFDHYEKTKEISVPAYQPIYAMDNDQRRELKQEILSQLQDLLIGLCHEDENKKGLANTFIGELVNERNDISSGFWSATFDLSNRPLVVVLHGTKINLRPSLMMIGMLIRPDGFLHGISKNEVMKCLPDYSLFKYSAHDRDRYYGAICQGYRHNSVHKPTQNYIVSLSKDYSICHTMEIDNSTTASKSA